MKRAIASVVLVGSIASRTALAINLVPYGNFDTANELVAWLPAGNGLPAISWDATESAIGATSSSGSVLIDIHGAAGTAGWIESACISVAEGPYRVGVWTKTKGSQPGSGPADAIGLLVNYYASPACVPNSAVGGAGLSYSMPVQWTQRYVDSIAPPGSMGAIIVVSIEKGPTNGGALTTWFDGIALETEEIFSGGFEGQNLP